MANDYPPSPTPAQRTPRTNPPHDPAVLASRINARYRRNQIGSNSPIPLELADFMLGTNRSSTPVRPTSAVIAALDGSDNIPSPLKNASATMDGRDSTTPDRNTNSNNATAMDVSADCTNSPASGGRLSTFSKIDREGDETIVDHAALRVVLAGLDASPPRFLPTCNWSMDSIPHPLSLVEPPPLEGFTPTYLVVLVGIEVGVFSGCSGLPPFENGFPRWRDAVGYYTDNFNAGNICIIKSTSGTNLNPIVVPSAAPTPSKKNTKDRATTSKRNIKASAQPVPSGSRQAGASGLAVTRVKKGKKRARVRKDDSDSEGYPPLYADDGEVAPATKKEVVVNVSDFDTPSPISKPGTS